MIRKIISINSERCNGCGLCAKACHEGAIGMVEGKARLLRDDYCDGLGDCLPVCPTDALSFVEREAEAYDEEAVKRHMAERAQEISPACGCPGASARVIERAGRLAATDEASELRQWPVQIRLAPISAPYFANVGLLIAADCAAYAYGGFHAGFMRGKATLIGCPKLDSVDYSDKLARIIRANAVASLTVVRMEVPCCGGLERAVTEALRSSGKALPLRSVTLSVKGGVVPD